MPDARCTRDLMRNVHKKCAHEHTGEAENIRHSLRNGFTAYNALSTRLCRTLWPRASHAASTSTATRPSS